MARILILFPFLLIFGSHAKGQLVLTEQTYDFGVLRRSDPNWADFPLVNHTDRDAVIFRLENPDNTTVLFSKKVIPPGDSATIRVQYRPEIAGPFTLKMDLFASTWSSPVQIVLKGESTYASDHFIPCPNFDEEPASRLRPLAISVLGTDGINPIAGAKIKVYVEGNEIESLRSDQNGEVNLELPLGRYFFTFEHSGHSVDTALFVNAVNDHLLVHLDKIPKPEPEPVPEITLEEREVSRADTEKDDIIHANEEMPSESDEGLLSSREFKQSNLVFLVDVSSSMKSNGKLDLLKISMVRLLDVLRPTDRFALISYASETGTLVETLGNLDKEECRKAIARLEAGGSTAGAKAIDKAGKKARDHFIDGGNNQIILATDGSFNEGASKAIKLSKKYREKDIELSVLGIRCGKFGEKEMRELAAAGGGRFVPVNDASDAGEQLINEIKTGARK